MTPGYYQFLPADCHRVAVEARVRQGSLPNFFQHGMGAKALNRREPVYARTASGRIDGVGRAGFLPYAPFGCQTVFDSMNAVTS